MKKILFSLFVIVLVICPFYVKAEKRPVLVYEFYGNGCPHCTNSFVWFEYIEKEYGQYFDLVKYEVWNDMDNNNLLFDVSKFLNKEVEGVPTIIVGDQVFIGFGESSKDTILNAIKEEYNKENRYMDLASFIYKTRNKDGIKFDNETIGKASASVNVVLDNVIGDILNKAI